MMLPRLQLLQELLRQGGSIWVTIDDNEGHYLKVLMDEVVGQVLCSSRSKDFSANPFERSADSIARYANPDNDPRGPWKAVDYLNQAVQAGAGNGPAPADRRGAGLSVRPSGSRARNAGPFSWPSATAGLS